MRFNYKLLYNSDYVLKILATFLLVISSVLLYFVILLKINYGIVHYYSFLTIILGFMLETFVELKLMPVIVEKYFKKWYNSYNWKVKLWLRKSVWANLVNVG